MLALVVPMGIFTIVIVALSAIVLTVRQWLTVREQVTITLNGQRRLEVTSGETLLSTLQDQGIELPAACGGRGSCGQCRVVVRDPGPLLPTEANHIHRREALNGTRLACMVKVRGDMDVQVPTNILEARRFDCRVVSNENISTYLKMLVLALPADEPFEFQAGDYVLLEAPVGQIDFARFAIDSEYEDEWQHQQLRSLAVTIPEPTTRAYSLANPPSSVDRLMLVVRIALPPAGARETVPPGMVSSYVFSLEPGDTVSISGPFGDFHAVEGGGDEMIFIGGGVGIAPLRSIIRDQLENRGATRPMSLWYGSRNLRELCFADEFEALAAQYENFTYHVALSEPLPETGWTGETGFIHNVVFATHLKDHPSPERAEYYLCGPPLMSAATLAMLEDLGVDRDNVHFDDFGGAI